MNGENDKPAVVVVTRNLPPLVGGMERLIWHLVDELREHYSVHVVGPRGCRSHLPDGVHVREVSLSPLPLFVVMGVLASLVTAVRARPRLLIAGSGLTAPLTWVAARLTRARVAIYLHGLDIQAPSVLYQRFWCPVFRLCDRVLVNSRHTRHLAVMAGIPEDRIDIVNPGVDVTPAQASAQSRTAFRERHGLGESPTMLYVGRITPRKGLAFFVESILPGLIHTHPDAKLVVIGTEPANALRRATGEVQRIRDALARNGIGDETVHWLGDTSDTDLRLAYLGADVLVFPVQDCPDDSEGFGMVAIEAAAHGLPTVAFAAGGVPDAVEDGVSGYLLEPNDTAGFLRRTTALLDDRSQIPADQCRAFAQRFAWPEFGKRLRTAFNRTVHSDP